jgi:hypothetical protein
VCPLISLSAFSRAALARIFLSAFNCAGVFVTAYETSCFWQTCAHSSLQVGSDHLRGSSNQLSNGPHAPASSSSLLNNDLCHYFLLSLSCNPCQILATPSRPHYSMIIFLNHIGISRLCQGMFFYRNYIKNTRILIPFPSPRLFGVSENFHIPDHPDWSLLYLWGLD